MNRLLILLIYSSAVLGHQEGTQRIDAINHALNQSPPSHQLYISRGDLFRQNNHFEAAEKDFQQAVQLGASPLAFAYHHQSQYLRQQNRIDEAKTMLIKAVNQLPDHHHEHELLAMAHLSLAEIYANQQMAPQAAHHIKQVIVTSSTAAPGLYLQAVDWIIAAQPKEYKAAYQLIDQGLTNHPWALVLTQESLGH